MNTSSYRECLLLTDSLQYLEKLYEQYLNDPRSVDPMWEIWFQQYGMSRNTASPSGLSAPHMERIFREYGHYWAHLDPLGLQKAPIHSQLFTILNNFFSQAPSPLSQTLQKTYCGTIGFQFMHLDNPLEQEWWLEKAEKTPRLEFSRLQKQDILQTLLKAEKFEEFLKRKFPTSKRFGLEGGEALIVGLESFVQLAAQDHVQEYILGSSHRGRLNIMANFMGVAYANIFRQFLGHHEKGENIPGFSGDVKYHQGARNTRTIRNEPVDFHLCANPSHLESINPVALGFAYIRQKAIERASKGKVIPILIHGDAAFMGQGIAAETLNMSKLPAYDTGGVIHIIINNQIGFTTSPQHNRTTPYCTDLVKGFQIPVLHVNGDDVESVVRCFQWAYQYRQKFLKDVMIDFVCYRRMGHNEIDEPTYTQPLMYQKIVDHPTTYVIYKDHLMAHKVIDEQEAQGWEKSLLEEMTIAFTQANKPEQTIPPKSQKILTNTFPLGIAAEKLKKIALAIMEIPEGFQLHPKLQKQLEQKRNLIKGGKGIDWAMAESLALGSLLQDKEGFNIRLSGQETSRGTFSQRHLKWTDTKTGESYNPLKNLENTKGSFEIIDTFLSEFAALGFEYGCSLETEKNLILWEAQFGDFINGAQIIIDQYIAAGAVKWGQKSKLVLLLPHGIEGQGPEHSSARLERFLQLCAHNNMIIANCTTPANYFHLLRHQAYNPDPCPLVIMTPKSLLRHSEAVSTLEDMNEKHLFLPLIMPETSSEKSTKIKRVILCSGKIYYELREFQKKNKISQVVIARLEQLYPFPEADIVKLLNFYPQAEIIWCQEEPQNMGAWSFVDRLLEQTLKQLKRKQRWPLCVARPSSPSPSTGYQEIHQQEQLQLINFAFSL